MRRRTTVVARGERARALLSLGATSRASSPTRLLLLEADRGEVLAAPLLLERGPLDLRQVLLRAVRDPAVHADLIGIHRGGVK